MGAYRFLAGIAAVLIAGGTACSDIHTASTPVQNIDAENNVTVVSGNPGFNAWIDGFVPDEALIDEGREIANERLQCEVCHHGAGRLTGTPVLYGMPARYLYKQLLDFAAGIRHDGVTAGNMETLARNLSDHEKRTVAVYYAAIELPTPDSKEAIVVSRAQEIIFSGASELPIPACINCHGLDSRGVAPWVPSLAGQDTDYLEAQLLAWKAGERSNDTSGEMSIISRRMTVEEIRAVSHFLGLAGR